MTRTLIALQPVAGCHIQRVTEPGTVSESDRKVKAPTEPATPAAGSRARVGQPGPGAARPASGNLKLELLACQ